MIGHPTARELARLREVLCEPAPQPDVAPALALSDDELCHVVDALHTLDANAGYLAYWAHLDAAEMSALSTIRQTVAELLGAFGG